MLIFQPTIRTLEFWALCCTDSNLMVTNGPTKIVSSVKGITVGHVIRAFAQIQQQHRLCPEADYIDHDLYGFLHPRISANGSIQIMSDNEAL